MTIVGLDVALSGFDLSFDISHLRDSTSNTLMIVTNIDVLSYINNSYIVLQGASTGIDVSLYSGTPDGGNSLVETYPIRDIFTYTSFRIVFYHEFIGIILDGRWVHTIYPYYIFYNTDTPSISLLSNYSETIANMRLKELSDWREAVYVDLETTSQNGISSIIQQRPVEIVPLSTGEVRFAYFPHDRDIIDTGDFLLEWIPSDQENPQICSEGIVYATNSLVVADQDTFDEYGFITRVFRLPDLDSGSVRAAKVMQKLARQQALTHDVRLRFNPAIEMGDIISSDLLLPGTGTMIGTSDKDTEGLSCIVEGIAIGSQAGNYSCQIKGRGNV